MSPLGIPFADVALKAAVHLLCLICMRAQHEVVSEAMTS